MKFRLTFAALLLVFLLPACRTLPTPTQETVSQLPRILEALHEPGSDTVLVAAHRGAHRNAPENSVASIEAAAALGVDIVEVDVRGTADGVLVLMHDADVERTTNGTGLVKELSFDELRDLRLSGEGEPETLVVPTLREALDAAAGFVVLDLDIKDSDPEMLLEVVRDADALNRVIFFKSDAAYLEALVALEPGILTMPRAYAYGDVKALIEQCAASLVHIDESFYNSETITVAHDADAAVWINALNLPDIAAQFLGATIGYGNLITGGADIIQTDRPGALLHYLRKQGLHW